MSVLEDTVAALETKLAEATATTGLWQYMLAGMGGALLLELLARPVWVRCTGRPFPLDQLLDKTVSPIVEKALTASHLAWARILAATLYVLRRRRSETVEVCFNNISYLLVPLWISKLCFVKKNENRFGYSVLHTVST